MYWTIKYNKKEHYRGKILSLDDLNKILTLDDIYNTFLTPENFYRLSELNEKGKELIYELLTVDYKKQKELLFKALINTGFISDKIAKYVTKVDRRKLLNNNNYTNIANLNCVIPIEGTNALFSPWLLCYIIKKLNITKGQNIAIFGIGNGYVIEVLSNIVGPKGKLTGVEINSDYISRAERIKKVNVELIHDNVFNYKTKNVYDLILTTLSVNNIPENWLSMLKKNGKISLFYEKPNSESCLIIGNFNSKDVRCEIMNNVYNLPFQTQHNNTNDKSFNKIENDFSEFIKSIIN
jgi:protein-L-isoaspartate O-methyltransferase